MPEAQLYDLEQDVGETTNLVARRPEESERLTALLRRYIDQGRSTPGPTLKIDVEVQWP